MLFRPGSMRITGSLKSGEQRNIFYANLINSGNWADALKLMFPFSRPTDRGCVSYAHLGMCPRYRRGQHEYLMGKPGYGLYHNSKWLVFSEKIWHNH